MDDARPRMLVFIDECLPSASFRATFESRGHTVRGVGEGFPSGSPDQSILAAANSAGAVVVSSDSDWRSLIRSIENDAERGRLSRAGRVLFNCPHDIAIQRLTELIEDIEREYAIASRRGDRLVMRITGGNFRVER